MEILKFIGIWIVISIIGCVLVVGLIKVMAIYRRRKRRLRRLRVAQNQDTHLPL